eukprot:gene6887-7611_t
MVELKAIDQWAFNYTGAVHGSDPACALGPPNTIFTPYPTFAYDQNPFYSSVGFLLGLAMIMSTMYPMSKLAKSVVEEKELRMRELMKIMGLQDWVHQLSCLQPWDHLPLLPSFHHVGDQPRLHGLCLLLELHELKAEGSGSMEMHELKAEGLATAGTVNRGPDRGSGPAHLPRIYPSSFFDSFPLRGEI